MTKMMMVLPSPTQNEFSAEARGEAFLAALDDVPAWASEQRSDGGIAAMRNGQPRQDL